MNTRPSQYPAPHGTRTVYAEHGVWFDPKTRHIHVTIGGREASDSSIVREHWSYAPGTREYDRYARLLAAHGRGPNDVMERHEAVEQAADDRDVRRRMGEP